MAICMGCGGVLGRDCYNEHDCVMISNNHDYHSGFEDGQTAAHDQIMMQPIIKTIKDIFMYRWKGFFEHRKYHKLKQDPDFDEIPF